jgi:hydrogenase nickel incorporation protein HypA/HybF
MHELAVTENILNITLQHAAQANAVRVTSLHLVIGQLSSIVDDSVQFYWDMISAETICEGAQLHFERRPAMLKCLDCDQIYALSGELTDCPNCHSARIKVVAGEEFYLDSIEVEAESALAPAARDTPA